MKRVGYIFEEICDLKNIKWAIIESSRKKRKRKSVKKILLNTDKYAREIQALLRKKAYTPAPYTEKTIMDGICKKIRTIHKPRYYPDQIIHWALILQIRPILMRGMYEYSCGSIPGRGTALGQKTLRRWLDKDYKGTRYCLQIDIKKFYPSIQNEFLKGKFRKIIKDKDCLWLIDTIIDSHQGLPIGNYTSPWFANFYLQGLDHFIKEKLGVKYYIRYTDDMILLGPNKKKLHKSRDEIEECLKKEGLLLKGNWQVYKVNDRPIDFLGLRFYRDKTILRKRTALRIRRRMAKIRKKGYLCYKDACAVISYWGWIKRSNSYDFYHKYVKPVATIKQARKVVSEHGKAHNLRTCA